MSETRSDLSSVFQRDAGIPRATEPEIVPCSCGLAEGMYNMGQFHLRNGEVVGWCHEYRELAAAVKRGTAALQASDKFSAESQNLERRMDDVQQRILELKAGGANR